MCSNKSVQGRFFGEINKRTLHCTFIRDLRVLMNWSLHNIINVASLDSFDLEYLHIISGSKKVKRAINPFDFDYDAIRDYRISQKEKSEENEEEESLEVIQIACSLG